MLYATRQLQSTMCVLYGVSRVGVVFPCVVHCYSHFRVQHRMLFVNVLWIWPLSLAIFLATFVFQRAHAVLHMANPLTVWWEMAMYGQATPDDWQHDIEAQGESLCRFSGESTLIFRRYALYIRYVCSGKCVPRPLPSAPLMLLPVVDRAACIVNTRR